MSLGITQTISSAMPALSAACFITAGAFAGRKVICGIACKAAAIGAGALGKPNAADLHDASAAYLAQAKADAPRDLAAATGFVLAGLFAKHAGETLKEASPKPEPTRYEKYIAPVVGFVVDYKKPIVGGVAVLAIFAGIKKLYSNPATPITQKPIKTLRRIPLVIEEPVKTVTQQPLRGAYEFQAPSGSTIKQVTTSSTELPRNYNIASKYGIGIPTNYEVPLPSFETMRASFFNT